MKLFKNKIVWLGLLGLVSLSSCKNEDFGDTYNQNTYGIYDSDYKSLMAGAISQLALRGGTNFYMKPALYVQHQSQVLYTTESQYAQVPGQWDWYYARSLNNLDKIIKDYSGDVSVAMAGQGSKNNMIGVSKIFRAIIYKRITDTYGDIPYSEANRVDEGIKTPKFDSQQSIYTDLIAELKEGRDLLNAAETTPKGDLLFGFTSAGVAVAPATQILRWKKLANSVLLQLSLQLSKKYPGTGEIAATEFRSALNDPAGVISTIADEAWFTFNVDAGVTNPLNAFRAADYRLSAELVESLKGTTEVYNLTSNHTDDARRTVYASNNNPGLPYGYSANGLLDAGLSATGKTQIATRFRGTTSPMNLMTAGYTFLNRAEAAARGWTSEDVAALLTNGIVSNYSTLDNRYATTISASATAYAAARVADLATFGALRVIGEEKWVLLFNNGFDAWSEYRRTGFPALKPAPNSLNGGVVPRRIIYPSTEQIFNATNYASGVSTLSPAQDLNTSKVWWDQ